MEKSIRLKFSNEFKEEAGKLVMEQRYKISEAARNLGIHATQHRRWVKAKTSETNPSTASMGQLEKRLRLKTVSTESTDNYSGKLLLSWLSKSRFGP
ncbi:transposase [Desulfobulbus propionicus]